MKQTKYYFTKSLLFIFFLGQMAGAVYYDTGEVEFQQPDSVTTFTGRAWGDEFLARMETQDGYRFAQGADGWYYYAVLDAEGKYAPGNLRVGIDSPPAGAYQLEPSASYLEQVEDARAAFAAQVREAALEFQQRQAEAIANNRAVEYTIGIILAEFKDIKHFKSDITHPLGKYREHGYLIEDFEKMFFSNKSDSNYNWYYPDDIPGEESPFPEGDNVFGSLQDYLWEVSRGNVDSVGALRIVGELVNPPDPQHPEVPQWITLDSTKAWYNDSLVNSYAHIAETITKAKINGWMSGDINDPFDFPYDRIVVISAGRMPPIGNLTPSSSPTLWWDCTEQYSIETPYKYFMHMGVHAHESGHAFIGLPDEYHLYLLPFGDWFDLMSLGSWNGPNRKGECPSLISPYYRLKNNWSNAIEINSDTLNLAVSYNYMYPEYYKINTLFDDDKFFLIENRRREGFDEYTPNRPADTTKQGGWLLAWKVEEDLDADFADPTCEFIPADGVLGNFYDHWIYRDFFPSCADGNPTPDLIQDLNDETFPSTKLQDSSYSKIAINRIKKDSLNSKIMRVDIYRDYWTKTIAGTETWSGDVTLKEYHVIIEDGGILNIEPGTDVKFRRSPISEFTTKILIKSGGTLNAVGTEQQIIKFHTTSEEVEDWVGIVLENGGNLNLKHCQIKYAHKALDLQNGQSLSLSGVEIDSCTNGVILDGSDNSLSDFKFSNTTKNLKIEGNNNVIHNSLFEGGSISLSNTDNNTIIQNSKFENQAIIEIGDGNSLQIRNNFFRDSRIYINSRDNSPVDCIIENNILCGNSQQETAILLVDSDILIPSIKNNTISHYQFGIYCESGLASPTISNNIFYQNSLTQDENGNLGGEGTIEYNNFYNIDNTGAPIGTNGNISVDPIFVNTAHDDYHLKGNSPCIDAGNPEDVFSNEPIPNGNCINMGAYGNTLEATHSFDIIVENDLAANTTWSGYVIVVNDVSTAGNNLTVEPGTKVYFEDGISLYVDAGIHADGSEDSITFRGYRDTDQMYGIILSEPANGCELLFCSFKNARYGLFLDGIQYSQNIFQNLTFQNSETGIYLSRAAAEISNCSFLNNTNGIISHTSNLNLHNSHFKENETQGLYLFDSVFDVNGNTFEDNWIRGVYFQYSSDGNFNNNIVKNNATIAHLVETHLVGGLVFYQSSPYISNNEITNNEAQGIISMSTSFPMLIEDGFNLVSENGQGHGENGPEIKVKDYSFPVIDYGHNDIVDNLGGYLVFGDEDEREGALYIRRNYWGTTDPEEIESRVYRPGGFVFIPYDSIPNTNGGVGEGGQEMFARAAEAESDSNYTLAEAIFDSVVNIHPATIYGKAALERLYVLKKKNGEDLITIKSYYDGLTNHQDEGIAVLAKRLSIRCQTNAAKYVTAVNEHQSWQPTMSYVCDSVYSEVDILTNQMLQSGTMFAKSGKSAISAKKTFLNKFSQYQKESEQILSQLFLTTNTKMQDKIPSTYALSQNYPNPFNPSTTIQYHIPFISDVKLTIYNILGQHIITLVDENKQPGSYKITWNGKNKYSQQVASGIYVYRLSANTRQKIFEKSKKMLLLK